MTYDDASLQSLGTLAQTALFVAWAVQQSLTSRNFQADFDFEINSLVERTITPGLFFRQCCEGTLNAEDLNRQGNAFVAHYLAIENGPFASDCLELLATTAASPCRVADSWDNFDRLKPRLDERYTQWQQGRYIATSTAT
uniref:DUF7832 domain-containing protein n=1 Tax=Pseudomonas laurentiana TaxID=2364649 RepID=UPI0029C8E07D|nr:hypothetical protein [Pseudomonas laurentiana]